MNEKLLNSLKSMGYTFGSILGTGQNGKVYDVGDKALKITQNKDNAVNLNRLRGIDHNNIIKVHRVFQLQSFPEWYMIEMEKLNPLEDHEKFNDIYDYLSDYDNTENKDLSKEIMALSDNPEESESILSNKDEDLLHFISWCYENNQWRDTGLELAKIDLLITKHLKQIQDLLCGLKALRDMKINHYDIHDGNIMKRKDNYVLIDLSERSTSSSQFLKEYGSSEYEPNNWNGSAGDVAYPIYSGDADNIKYAKTPAQKVKGLRGIALEDWSGMMVFKNVKEGDVFVGEDCLFDIRIAFLDSSGKVLSVGVIDKGTGRVIAPKGTDKAIETAENDAYKFMPGQMIQYVH